MPNLESTSGTKLVFQPLNHQVIKKDRCGDLLKFKHKLSISSGGKNKHRGIPSPYYFFGISQILRTLIISKLIKISLSQRSTNEKGQKELLKFYYGGCKLVLLMLLVSHVYCNSVCHVRHIQTINKAEIRKILSILEADLKKH